jgi:hypothetical protein
MYYVSGFAMFDFVNRLGYNSAAAPKWRNGRRDSLKNC